MYYDINLKLLSGKNTQKVNQQKIVQYCQTVHQNNQNFIEMTSNMICIVAIGGGLKCPRKIHLNPQCPPPLAPGPSSTPWTP